MKKLGLTLVAAFSLATMSFAAGIQPTTAKWEGNVNVNKLSQFLALSADQKAEVSNISKNLSTDMAEANNATADSTEKKLTRKAVYSNLKLMKQTLTQEQYAKYTRVVNATLNNKGIVIE